MITSKNVKKTTSLAPPLVIENAKIEKQKTWPHSKIQCPKRQICVFTCSQCFSTIENDHSFFQVNGEDTNEKLQQRHI